MIDRAPAQQTGLRQSAIGDAVLASYRKGAPFATAAQFQSFNPNHNVQFQQVENSSQRPVAQGHYLSQKSLARVDQPSQFAPEYVLGTTLSHMSSFGDTIELPFMPSTYQIAR